MAVLPIIERELRVALRKQRPVQHRVRVATYCAGGVLLFVLLATLTGNRNGSRDLHQLMCLAGLYTVLRAPRLTAGIFASERREQTLGLLFLSGLSAGEVFLSKVISAAAIAFTDLLAIFPFLALPFLMGGISFDLFLATVFCLPGSLLFALSVSLLASVLTEDDGAAVLLACLVALFICGAPLVLYLADQQFSGNTFGSGWLRVSPAYGPWLVFTRFSSAPAGEFWKSFTLTLMVSAACQAVAAFWLGRLWRDRRQDHRTQGLRQLWGQIVHGNSSYRRRLASRWLNTYPFTWLAARSRQPTTLAFLVLAVILTIWMAGFLIWPHWASIANFFITATVMNLGLRWLIYHTAAAGLANPRTDGSYELLLTSLLYPAEIVRGQLKALRVQFRLIGKIVFGLELAMMFAGLLLRQWTVPSLFVYLAIWLALLFWEWQQSWKPRSALLSMWAGLNSARPAHAVWRAFGFNSWVWIWILFNLKQGISGLQSFPTGSVLEVLLVSIGLFILLVYMFRPGATADSFERRLVFEFREIVREPLPDPNDPRFKQWNIRERFPWGWKILQQQLHERIARRQTDGSSYSR
jgi:ABC-type transport system involved in multi-copper enzyme maturation permease subunit